MGARVLEWYTDVYFELFQLAILGIPRSRMATSDFSELSAPTQRPHALRNPGTRGNSGLGVRYVRARGERHSTYDTKGCPLAKLGTLLRSCIAPRRTFFHIAALGAELRKQRQ